MSGGSYDYAYQRVREMATDSRLSRSDNARRRAFAKHLMKVAEAMQDIEWVDSQDRHEGDENKAIDECLTHSEILGAEREHLEEAIACAKRTLEEFGGKP